MRLLTCLWALALIGCSRDKVLEQAHAQNKDLQQQLTVKTARVTQLEGELATLKKHSQAITSERDQLANRARIFEVKEIADPPRLGLDEALSTATRFFLSALDQREDPGIRRITIQPSMITFEGRQRSSRVEWKPQIWEPINRDMDRLGEFLERQLDQRLRSTGVIRILEKAPYRIRGEYYTDGTVQSRVARVNLRLITSGEAPRPAAPALTLLLVIDGIDRHYTHYFLSFPTGNPCQSDDYDRLRESSRKEGLQ